MSTDNKPLAASRLEADAARADLLAVWGEIQRRVMPATLVRDGIDVVKDKAGEVAEDAVDFARRKPAVVAGVAAAAVALVARRPIARLVERIRRPDPAQLEMKIVKPRRIGARKETGR